LLARPRAKAAAARAFAFATSLAPLRPSCCGGHRCHAAGRLDPEYPQVRLAAASAQRTTGVRPAILPNLGGAIGRSRDWLQRLD